MERSWVQDRELQLIGLGDGRRAEPLARELGEHGEFRALHRKLDQLGFAHWAYCAVPNYFRPCDRPPLRITSYPHAHVAACIERNLYLDCPGLGYALCHDGPAEFSTVRDRTTPSSRLQRLLTLNRRHAVTRGMIVPLHDVLGMKAVVALSFSGSPREWETCWHELRHELIQLAYEFNRALLPRHARDFSQPFLPTLSARQRDAIRLLAEGESTAAIADRMQISVHTLNKHIAALKQCTGTSTSAQLTAFALQWGVI